MSRLERDSMGTIEVPEACLWGAQTERARQHFAISDERMPLPVIHALAMIKQAAARVNGDLGLLPADTVEAIMAAAAEVQAGRHDQAFPLMVWQTGSGTQTNMNLNEVLANRASELLGGARGLARRVHPNDEVNLGQSSNDVFPSAMHLAALGAVQRLLPDLERLRSTLAEKSAAFAGIIKIGRTHLQDATPLTLGQEFSAFVAQLAHAAAAIEAARPGLFDLAIGGTAVGTGLNSHPEFGPRVAAELARMTGQPFRVADNRFAALAAHADLASMHAALKGLALTLIKIANDIRWLASGPRCGLGELHLPENEPGSSIMPGKVNPTQSEAMIMVCYQVMANDVAIGLAAAHGHFQLNVCKPLITQAFLQSARLLADAMASFERYCVCDLSANEARIAELLGQSLMLVTALSPHVGYDHAAEIAHLAHANGLTLRAAALQLGHVSAEEFDRWTDPSAMLGQEALTRSR